MHLSLFIHPWGFLVHFTASKILLGFASRALGWEVPRLLGWEAWPGVPAPLAKESFQAEDGLTVARGMRGEELMD